MKYYAKIESGYPSIRCWRKWNDSIPKSWDGCTYLILRDSCVEKMFRNMQKPQSFHGQNVPNRYLKSFEKYR
jgi:hypothetical protein